MLRLRVPFRGALLAAAALVHATGCGAIFGLSEKQLGDPDAAATGDGAPGGDDADVEASREGGVDGASLDAPPSSCTFDSDGFGDIHAGGCWATFDLTRADPAVASVPGTEGVAFDGRYLYLAPQPGAIVMRYDTTAAFADPLSWSSFDVKAKLGFQPRFSGALFDGRYVTFVPRSSSPLVVRYDTKAGFADVASWETFDPTPLGADAVGFAGATCDGQYDYLVPRDHAILLRHPATAAIGSGWETFDVAQVQSSILTAFWGAVYDGHAVYLAPEGDGVVVRYDASKPFGSPSSWSKFDTAALHPDGLTLLGAAFDGRYVYMGPADADSIVARYDTQGTFTDAAAWALFDMGTLTPLLGLFSGVAFDGRFTYYTPVGTTNGNPNLLMGRYDTTKPFGAAGSWLVFDFAPVGAGPFDGSAYDGRFVYFTPSRGTKIARFEARRAVQKLTLPAFFGSFF